MRIEALTVAALVAGWWTPAMAGPGQTPPTVVDGRQVRAPPEVTAAHERLQAQARLPVRRPTLLEPGPGVASVVKGKLHYFDDGVAVIAVEVSAAQVQVLERLGARRVLSEQSIRHHTIWKGHYFRELYVAPPPGAPCAGCVAQRLMGPDPARMRRRVGQMVVLEVKRDRRARHWVTAIR